MFHQLPERCRIGRRAPLSARGAGHAAECRHAWCPAELFGWLLFSCWVLLSANTSRAGTTSILLDDRPQISIGHQVELWEDTSASATLSDALNARGWTLSNVAEPNQGFTSSAWWARLRVSTSKPQKGLWYLQVDDAILNQVDVSFILNDGSVIESRGGGWVEFAERPVPYRTHVFQLPVLSPGESLDIYMRIESELAVVLPARLLSANTFHHNNLTKTLIYAFYFGFLGAILVFNLYVAIRTRSILHLSYSAYLCGVILISLSFSGLGMQFIWSHLPTLDNVIFPIACSSAMIFGMYFIDLFLFGSNFSGYYIQQRRRVLLSLSCLAILLAIWGNAFIAIQCSVGTIAISIVNAIVNIFLGIKLKKHNAKMLAVAWSGLLVGIGIFVGRGFGWLPSNFLTTHSMEVATVFECFLLVVALIEKTRNLEDELKQASERAKITLQRQVEDRTRELVSAQQQLLFEEKKAAVNTLTAGVAHEINNPANFVSAGAQNACAQADELLGFLNNLLDDDAEHEIKSSFVQHTGQLTERYNLILQDMGRIRACVLQLQAMSPEGNSGLTDVDISHFMESVTDLWQQQSSGRLHIHWGSRSPGAVSVDVSSLTHALTTCFTHMMAQTPAPDTLEVETAQAQTALTVTLKFRCSEVVAGADLLLPAATRSQINRMVTSFSGDFIQDGWTLRFILPMSREFVEC